jgi:branched-chain amino acid transport system permease protein
MKNLRKLLKPTLFAAGLFLCVLINETGIVSNTLKLILQYIAIYSIFVLGINIINGYLGIFSLAHAGIMAIGGYAASLMSMHVLTAPLFFPLNLFIGGLVSMLIGLIVAFPSFTVRGDYLAIITLGFSLLVQSLIENIDSIGASSGLRPIPKYTNIVWAYLFLALEILLVKRLVGSKYGRSLLAIRRDQVASELVSVNVRQVKLVAFGLSSFLIGISGALICHLLCYTNPGAYGYHLIIEGLIMVYLGGIGSVTGSIIGATLWQILVETLRVNGMWRWILGAVVLILLMVFKPTGLFGNREISLEWCSNALSAVRNVLKKRERRRKEGGQ